MALRYRLAYTREGEFRVIWEKSGLNQGKP